MSEENVSGPSWELLPMEILEKIFGFLPRLSLGTVGIVCSQWENVVHRCAVKYMISCMDTGRLGEKQLERFGWKTSAAWDHDNTKCSCIHLAFNFFTRKGSVSVQEFSQECLEGEDTKAVAVLSDKVIHRVVDRMTGKERSPCKLSTGWMPAASLKSWSYLLS